MNFTKRRLIVLATAVITGTFMLAGVMAATGASAAGPYSFTSAGNPNTGIDEEAGVYTLGANFTPVSVSGSGTYQELVSSDGKCLTAASLTSITAGTCSTTNTRDLWWVLAHAAGDYLLINEANNSNACTWPGGTTQRVLTGATQGAGLTIACDDSPNGSNYPYGLDQQWAEAPPVAPSPSASPSSSPSMSPSPSPSPSPSSSSPPPGCPTVTAAPVAAGPDIPNATHVGALETSLTGADLLNWDHTQTKYDDGNQHLRAPTLATDGSGSADLSTVAGTTESETMIASCSSIDGTGGNYEFGIFQVVMKFPVSGSACQVFGAIWLSNPNQAAWPNGTEIDINECLGGVFRSTFHADVNPSCEGGNCAVTTESGPNITPAAGYHTFDLIWASGSVTFFYDGAQTYQYKGSDVTGSVPLELILDNSCPVGKSCAATDAYVSSVEVWGYQ